MNLNGLSSNIIFIQRKKSENGFRPCQIVSHYSASPKDILFSEWKMAHTVL